MTKSQCHEVIRGHQNDPPVQMIPIAEELGISVFRVKGWPDEVSGQIIRDPKDGGSRGYAINTNAGHAVTRRRFTIAHEIAHFVLHRHLIGDGIQDDALYRSGIGSPLEAEANRLAADILMPWHLVRGAIRGGSESVETLARRFHVSRSAMSIRLGVPWEGIETRVDE